MPKTKFQEYVFAVIMVFVMVYAMTFYNAALEEGLHNFTFLEALKTMWFEFFAAFIVQKFIVGPIVRKKVSLLLTPGVDRQIFVVIATAGLTVSMMAPIMTLIVSLMHNGFTPDILALWLPKLALNFPFALLMQICYIGPLVRFLFRSIFKRQLELSSNLTVVRTENVS